MSHSVFSYAMHNTRLTQAEISHIPLVTSKLYCIAAAQDHFPAFAFSSRSNRAIVASFHL